MLKRILVALLVLSLVPLTSARIELHDPTGSVSTVFTGDSTPSYFLKGSVLIGTDVRNANLTVNGSSYLQGNVTIRGNVTFADNNTFIHLKTNDPQIQTNGYNGDLIILQWTNTTGKPTIAWRNESGDDKAWLVTHDTLTGGTEHKHFSIETSNKSGGFKSRMEFPWDCDLCDIQIHDGNLTLGSSVNLHLSAGDIVHDQELDLFPYKQYTQGLRIMSDANGPVLAGLGGVRITINETDELFGFDANFTGNITAKRFKGNASLMSNLCLTNGTGCDLSVGANSPFIKNNTAFQTSQPVNLSNFNFLNNHINFSANFNVIFDIMNGAKIFQFRKDVEVTAGSLALRNNSNSTLQIVSENTDGNESSIAEMIVINSDLGKAWMRALPPKYTQGGNYVQIMGTSPYRVIYGNDNETAKTSLETGAKDIPQLLLGYDNISIDVKTRFKNISFEDPVGYGLCDAESESDMKYNFTGHYGVQCNSTCWVRTDGVRTIC